MKSTLMVLSPSLLRDMGEQDQRLDWGEGTCLACACPGLNITAKGARVSLGLAQIPTPAAIIANVSNTGLAHDGADRRG